MSTKIYILIVLAFLMTLGCGSGLNSDSVKEEVVEQLTEEELKEQLRQKECESPNNYLTGNLSWEGKFKHALSMKVNKLALKCVISSSATMATYKDIKCHVNFLSKTGSVVLEEEFTVYEFIAPNNATIYKTLIGITNQQYKDIFDSEWYIVSASCD